ncbi:MAG: NAD(P)H-hydrate dehydratase [Minisyncoccia bacterium]
MRLKKYYPKRKKWVHKGDFGYVLIVAGSERFTGSPIFNGVAALRAGADLVTIVGHQRAMDVVASFLPDLITYPLDGELHIKHVPKILELAKNFDALIIGGGLKRDKKTYKAIREIIKKINLPMVIDAEAIRAVAEDKKILKNKMAVLTPHSEEFRILTGEKVSNNLKERKEKVKKWAKKLKTVILLKGNIDIISDGEKVFLNKTGSPFMTKGGFGDTLTGICGALLARGVFPFEAAKVAAFINGKAGEIAAKKYGEGVMASDIFELIEKIPKVIKKYY